MSNSTVGLLALQGSFAEHEQILKKLNIEHVLVRSVEDLSCVTHLIIPGGESTTMRKLLQQYDMWDELIKRVQDKSIKILGTCAGAILCQDFGFDVKIERNGYGPQQHSFTADLTSDPFPNLRGMFIRAPRFETIGNQVHVLATFQDEPVLLQQDNMLIMSFHPELLGETRIHEYFVGDGKIKK